MRIVDFAKMLQGSINEKIKDCKYSIHKLHNPIYNKSLEVEIEALEWVKGQVQHLVRKDTKLRIWLAALDVIMTWLEYKDLIQSKSVMGPVLLTSV